MSQTEIQTLKGRFAVTCLSEEVANQLLQKCPDEVIQVIRGPWEMGSYNSERSTSDWRLIVLVRKH